MIVFRLNYASDIPLHKQMKQLIRRNIHEGTLPCTIDFPLIKDICSSSSIPKAVIRKAYKELKEEGILNKTKQN